MTKMRTRRAKADMIIDPRGRIDMMEGISEMTPHAVMIRHIRMVMRGGATTALV